MIVNKKHTGGGNSRNAFTLVELMGVIIILGIVSLIAIPIIDRQLKEGKKDLSDTQIANIKKSAELWGADNIYNLPDNGDNCYLMYSTLVNSGYADEGLKELSSNTSLTDNNLKIEISKDSNYSKYTYTVEFNKDGFTDIPDKYCNARYDYTNLVKNGSFEDGLNEWTIGGSDSNTIITSDIVDNKKVLKNTSTSSSGYKYVRQIGTWLENHTYYYTVKALGNSSNTGGKKYGINTVSNSFYINANISNWTKGSNRFIVASTQNQPIEVGWDKMTGTVYIDDVMVVDLTESFGSGKEPSKEWCDKYLDYVEYGSVNYAYYK